MEVHKTVLSRIPLLKVTGNVDHLSAQVTADPHVRVFVGLDEATAALKGPASDA